MYFGHLIVPGREWMAYTAGVSGRRFALCFPTGFLDDVATGDPVFIADGQGICRHAAVSFAGPEAVAWVLTHRGPATGAASVSELRRLFPLLPPLTDESVVDVLMLMEPTHVSPSLSLASLGIGMSGDDTYRPCDPYDVLVILRALPLAAQTVWTRKIVARDNEIGTLCSWPRPDLDDLL